MENKPDITGIQIEAALCGKQTAFKYLMDTFWDQVYRFQLKRTQSDYEAEEITIQTFARAFSNIHQYDKTYNFSTWLLTISRNLHIDSLRKEKNTEEWRSDIKKNKLSKIIDQNPTPEDALITKQSRAELMDYVKQLKAPYQEIIQLRYFQDLSYKEIAKQLEEPINNVKVKLLRARRLLADLILKSS